MTDNSKPMYFKQVTDTLIPNNVSDKEPPHVLPDEIKNKIDEWVKRYPEEGKASGVFEALRLVQERFGFLDVHWMDAVADHLTMSRVGVYEVAAFYTMFYLNPMGKHIIDVCTNISCQLNGSEDLLNYLKKKLGIKLNETTADGRFTLREVECLGACVAPPVCQIGKKYYENLTPEKMDEILETLK